MDNAQGGPVPLSDILVPVRIRPAKSSDIPIRAGNHVIFISKYQIQWIAEITMSMVPRLLFEDGDYGF